MRSWAAVEIQPLSSEEKRGLREKSNTEVDLDNFDRALQRIASALGRYLNYLFIKEAGARHLLDNIGDRKLVEEAFEAIVNLQERVQVLDEFSLSYLTRSLSPCLAGINSDEIRLIDAQKFILTLSSVDSQAFHEELFGERRSKGHPGFRERNRLCDELVQIWVENLGRDAKWSENRGEIGSFYGELLDKFSFSGRTFVSSDLALTERYEVVPPVDPREVAKDIMRGLRQAVRRWSTRDVDDLP